MAISQGVKIKLQRYISKHSIEEMKYSELLKLLNKEEKTTVDEFLDFFITRVIKELKKDGKLYPKNLIPIFAIITDTISVAKSKNKKISKETLDKIRCIEKYYDDYLKRTGKDSIKELKDGINLLLENVNRLYPTNENNDELFSYVKEIDKLREELKSLTKQLSDFTIRYDDLQRSSGRLKEKCRTLSSKNDENEIELKRLRAEIEKATESIDNLTQQLASAEKENKELADYRKLYEDLKREFDELKSAMDEKLAFEEQENNRIIIREKASELVYGKLLETGCTITEMITYLNSKGLELDRESVFNIINYLKRTFNIESRTFSLEPVYRIFPFGSSSKKFSITIPDERRYFDILLVSDMHIDKVNNGIMRGIEHMGNYCIKNGIPLVLNLGDFLQGNGGFNSSDAKMNYSLLEEIVKRFPQMDGVYHAILGGNHEKNVFRYGFDPLAILQESRSDFINLGYTHAIIELLNSKRNLVDSFGIHHPDTYDWEINLDEFGLDTSGLNRYLDSVYKRIGRSRNNSCFDIFGHTHKSQYNISESYIFVPAYFSFGEKCVHLRVYIDDDYKFKEAIFMPLILKKQLVKSNEIVYSKRAKQFN